MKVVVTGSNSFVGREFIKQCKDLKISIVGLDTIDVKNTDYQFYNIDIRSPNVLQAIPDNADAIIHLAALSRDTDCKGRGYECFDVNVMGTLNLIKASIKRNVKQFIFASSEWVYDFKGNEERDESSVIDITNHTSEYALSKLVSESNLRQQFLNGFCSVTILRFGIIYGPRKDNWSAVESIMSQIKNKSEITIGSLKSGRRFVHVSDIANGLVKSIGLSGFNIINLTGNKVNTLEEIIMTGQKILMKTAQIHETNPSQVSIRNPSNYKAKNILGWEPKIQLDDGLRTILPFV